LNGLQTSSTGDLSHDKTSDTVRRVSLIVVALDNHALIHHGLVSFFVFTGIVRMYRMGLVNAQHKTPFHSSLKDVGVAAAVRQCRCDSLDGLTHDGRSGSDTVP
jgi:hypothetical protein